jgi:hypothetical protein
MVGRVGLTENAWAMARSQWERGQGEVRIHLPEQLR